MPPNRLSRPQTLHTRSGGGGGGKLGEKGGLVAIGRSGCPLLKVQRGGGRGALKVPRVTYPPMLQQTGWYVTVLIAKFNFAILRSDY